MQIRNASACWFAHLSHPLPWFTSVGLRERCAVHSLVSLTFTVQSCNSGSKPARAPGCVRGTLAGRLIDEMRSGATADMAPGELGQQQVVRLHQLLHEARFADPDGAHLSPAGEPRHSSRDSAPLLIRRLWQALTRQHL